MTIYHLTRRHMPASLDRQILVNGTRGWIRKQGRKTHLVRHRSNYERGFVWAAKDFGKYAYLDWEHPENANIRETERSPVGIRQEKALTLTPIPDAEAEAVFKKSYMAEMEHYVGLQHDIVKLLAKSRNIQSSILNILIKENDPRSIVLKQLDIDPVETQLWANKFDLDVHQMPIRLCEAFIGTYIKYPYDDIGDFDRYHSSTYKNNVIDIHDELEHVAEHRATVLADYIFRKSYESVKTSLGAAPTTDMYKLSKSSITKWVNAYDALCNKWIDNIIGDEVNWDMTFWDHKHYWSDDVLDKMESDYDKTQESDEDDD